MPGMGGMMGSMWIWALVGVLFVVFLVIANFSPASRVREPGPLHLNGFKAWPHLVWWPLTAQNLKEK